MAENLVRNIAYQVHCNGCENDTLHSELNDVVECSVCGLSELSYVLKQEGRVTEIVVQKKEQAAR